MSTRHLTEDELDRLLAGEEPNAEVSTHLGECLVCRRRRDAFLAAVAGAVGTDPDVRTSALTRARALAEWGADSPHRRHVRAWLAAAAVLVVALLIPILRTPSRVHVTVNADTVLAEVDTVLDRDPLTTVANEDVVETVVPDHGQEAEGSTT